MASSGSMLRTGSQLPYSSLLPMPPPPSEAELGPAFSAVHTPCERRPSYAPAQGATGMVRSYSVPVATQVEHEEHQRVFARSGSAGAGFARLHTAQFEIPAWHHTFGMSTARYSPSRPKQLASTSPKHASPPRAARSPLSPISPNLPITYQQELDESAEYAADMSGADLSRASDMSDEARTPRASSPAHTFYPLPAQNKLEAWPHVLIHPDHLA